MIPSSENTPAMAEILPPLEERLGLFMNHAEAISLSRVKQLAPTEEPSELGASQQAASQINQIASELGLLGESIIAMGGSPWYEQTNPETGMPETREAFGVIGILSGVIHMPNRGWFCYVLDLPTEEEGKTVRHPHGYAVVGASGLHAPSFLER